MRKQQTNQIEGDSTKSLTSSLQRYQNYERKERTEKLSQPGRI